MIDINELRRLAQAATPGPWKMLPVGDGRQKFAVADSKFLSILTVTDEGGATFGTVYDDVDAKFMTAANPAAITELLDRLEAAEKERDALRAALEKIAVELEFAKQEIVNLHDDINEWMDKCERLEAAEKKSAATMMLADRLALALNTSNHERDALRAKVEAMEKQEPVAKVRVHQTGGNAGVAWSAQPLNDFDSLPLLRDGDKLYALPGAKGE